MATRRRASSLGTAPDRTAGLDIDLGPLPPALPTAAPAPARQPTDTVPSTQSTPQPAESGARTTATATADGPARRPRGGARSRRPEKPSIRIVSARIPVSLFTQVNESREAAGDTHEMWFLSGLDAVMDELEKHYQRSERPSRVPIPRRRARRPGVEPLVQYPLRLTVEAAAVLDELAAELKPVSMSEFVTTIVRLRLAQLDQPAPSEKF